MNELSLSEVRKVVRGCLESESPTSRSECLAKREKWLSEIEAGSLVASADALAELLESRMA